MQSIQLSYDAEGMAVHFTKVIHNDLSQNGSYIPDGINRGSCYARFELDDLFAKLGWHLVSDTNGVLTYAGPLRPMPIATA